VCDAVRARVHRPGSGGSTIARGDAAMYAAKQRGRHGVVMAGGMMSRRLARAVRGIGMSQHAPGLCAAASDRPPAACRRMAEQIPMRFPRGPAAPDVQRRSGGCCRARGNAGNRRVSIQCGARRTPA